MKSARGARWLFGRFRLARNLLKSHAGRFVNALYEAGAFEVIATDIFSDKAGDQYQYVDCALVQLPKSKAARKAIRKVSQQLHQRKLGATQPEEDIGETICACACINPGICVGDVFAQEASQARQVEEFA